MAPKRRDLSIHRLHSIKACLQFGCSHSLANSPHKEASLIYGCATAAKTETFISLFCSLVHAACFCCWCRFDHGARGSMAIFHPWETQIPIERLLWNWKATHAIFYSDVCAPTRSPLLRMQISQLARISRTHPSLSQPALTHVVQVNSLNLTKQGSLSIRFAWINCFCGQIFAHCNWYLIQSLMAFCVSFCVIGKTKSSPFPVKAVWRGVGVDCWCIFCLLAKRIIKK